MEINAKTEVNTTVLAVVLGVTARRIQQLAQDGVITAHSRGKYLLCDAVRRYLDYCTREKVLSKAENDKLDADVSIKKAKAIITVLEAKELQGKMHRSEDVANMTEDLIYAIRGMILALPGRLAIDAASLTEPSEVSALIRKECYHLLKELSQYRYDSKKYEERVRKRKNWEQIASEVETDEDS